MRTKTTTRRKTTKKEEGVPTKKPTLTDAFKALQSMPDDFFADGRVDPPPEDCESWYGTCAI
jgi:hypothetical protein